MSIVVPALPDRNGKLTIVPIVVEDGSGIEISQIKAEIEKQNPDLKVWDPVKERDPAYLEGDNRTRSRFAFSAYHHPKGALLSGIKAKIIIKAIDFAHKAILKGYDMDAYVYDDPRLKAQNDFFRQYIQENFRHAEYKTEFMNKIVDIIMFLVKEDIYYRRLMDMLNKRPIFELNNEEKENIERWH